MTGPEGSAVGLTFVEPAVALLTTAGGGVASLSRSSYVEPMPDRDWPAAGFDSVGVAALWIFGSCPGTPVTGAGMGVAWVASSCGCDATGASGAATVAWLPPEPSVGGRMSGRGRLATANCARAPAAIWADPVVEAGGGSGSAGTIASVLAMAPCSAMPASSVRNPADFIGMDAAVLLLAMAETAALGVEAVPRAANV